MKSLADYESELHRRVPTVTLLGQLPYDESDLAALRLGLRPLFADGAADGLRRVRARAELAFALYLVLEGTYHYTAGDYWHGPRLALGLDAAATPLIGRRFRHTLRGWGLPTFEHLGGHVHVTPILAHVGIPNYCLDDFFDLLNRALRQDAAPDAATLMADWGESDFPPAIDKPVQRFLRAGGPIAQDFVDRCLDLWQPGDPTALGLPRRVLGCHETWRAGRDDRAPALGPRLVRPALTLDPYGEGPALVLAPVTFPAERAPARLVWRIEAGERRREETAVRRRRGDEFEYSPRDLVNVLTVAPRYTITLLADDQPLPTWTLPGPADPPLLAFDPADGRALPLGQDAAGEAVLSPGERWLAFPRGWSPAPTGDAQLLADLPDQPGEWAAFAFQTWRLGPGARLELLAPDGRRAAFRAHYDAPPPRPLLFGGRVAGDAPGAPALYGRPPDLLLPRHARDEQPAAWHYALEPIGPAQPATARRGTLDALAERLVVDEDGLWLPLDAPELLGPAPFGAFRLRLRGPYGRTADFELRLVPGLRLADYPRLYRGQGDGPAAFTAVVAPGVVVEAAPDAPGVTVGSPHPTADGRAWPVAVAAEETRAGLRFRGGAIAVESDVPLYRLRWGVYEPERPDRFAWRGRPPALCPDELDNRHTAEVRVDRPFWGERPPLTGWRLIAPDGRVVRQQPPGDRPAGRYVATRLAEWLDAYQEARGPVCLQLLLVEGAAEATAIDVLSLQPALDVGPVAAEWRIAPEGETLSLLWERDTRRRGRQFRLWPLDRPWQTEPVVLSIADSAEGFAAWSLPPGLLPPGETLGQMVIANPWAEANGRPTPGAPGVFVVRPDDFERVLAERVAAVTDGEAGPDDALALLLGLARHGPRDLLADAGRALHQRRAELSPEQLRLWANAARDCGSTPAYRLARQALFDPARVALAAAERPPALAAAWLDHLSPGLPHAVYATLLPLAADDRRALCRDELCRAGHAAGFAALLDDVGRGRIRFDDALTLLEGAAEAAVDFLLAARHESVPAVLRALLRRRPAIELIAVGGDVQTNAGYGVVTAIDDQRTGRAVAACRNASPGQPYTLRVTFNPATAPVLALIDLGARRIALPEPVYKCRHNGAACQRVFGSAEELARHYRVKHKLLVPYIMERAAVPPLPLTALCVLPPDGVKS